MSIYMAGFIQCGTIFISFFCLRSDTPRRPAEDEIFRGASSLFVSQLRHVSSFRGCVVLLPFRAHKGHRNTS